MKYGGIDCCCDLLSSVDVSAMPVPWCSPSTGVEYVVEDDALYCSASFPGSE